jgi:PhnB protein
MASANPTRQDRNTLIPNLVCSDAAKAIDFYVKALGAQEVMRMPSPDGKAIWHAELRIGDTMFYVNDAMPGMGPTPPTPESPAPTSMWVAASDCDAAFQRAVAAGGKPTMPPADMFWGDRVAAIVDPFGYQWSFATHVKDLTFEEMRRAGEEFARTMGQQQGARP